MKCLVDYTKSSVVYEDVKRVAAYLRKLLVQHKGKSFLITGAHGMIGNYIVQSIRYANNTFLKRSPIQLYLVSRSSAKTVSDEKYIHVLHGDIATMKLPLKQFDFIIHAASNTAPKLYTEHPIDTLKTNVLGFFNILSSNPEKSQGILFISSSEVYGGQEHEGKTNENRLGTIDQLSIRSSYVEAKRFCESMSVAYNQEVKSHIKIARLFHTFGPGMNMNDGRVFSDFIHDGVSGNDIQILGDKTMKRAFLYLSDAVIMLLLVLFKGEDGEVYNIGNDTNIASINSFARAVARESAYIFQKNIHVSYKNGNIKYFQKAVRSITPDISKFKKNLHYNPVISLQEACRRTLRYYKEINYGTNIT